MNCISDKKYYMVQVINYAPPWLELDKDQLKTLQYCVPDPK